METLEKTLTKPVAQNNKIMDRKFNIFIVDDSDIFRALAEKIIEDLNIRFSGIASFRSGEGCLSVIDENPDIVLLDYQLGKGIDGLETLKQIKKYSPDSKVIAMTAFDNFLVSTKFRLWGASDYITKGGRDVVERIQKSVKRLLNEIKFEEKLKGGIAW